MDLAEIQPTFAFIASPYLTFNALAFNRFYAIFLALESIVALLISRLNAFVLLTAKTSLVDNQRGFNN